jgi:uncharacterized protein (TIGR02391 family)
LTLEELTDDEVIELAVEQLALLVLAYVERSSDLVFVNFIRSGHVLDRSYAAKSALAEAWNWLERKGLLGPNIEQGPGWQTITRAGRQVVEEGQPALARLRAAERLDVELHPSLALLVRPQFLIGSYEMAVFEAFKAVEVRLRELANSPAERTGVQMAKDAFGEQGPLRDPDPTVPKGEKDGLMALFWGAFGALRNPPGHRYVDYDSPAEASEAVMLASLLMRVLDRVAMQQRSFTP